MSLYDPTPALTASGVQATLRTCKLLSSPKPVIYLPLEKSKHSEHRVHRARLCCQRPTASNATVLSLAQPGGLSNRARKPEQPEDGCADSHLQLPTDTGIVHEPLEVKLVRDAVRDCKDCHGRLVLSPLAPLQVET